MTPAAALLCILAGTTGALAAADAPIRFNRDIRPLIAENCFHCHGPDPGSRKAKLRFDREDGFFAARGKDGKDSPTVVKGKPDESPFYQHITSKDPDEVMPPPAEHKVLKPEQKELLRRWIAQGAPWEAHWAFIPPERPALPTVAAKGWVRNPIDSFVLARLEAAGVAPAPEADRRTLARRLALDLTGLPPEPATVDAFATDQAADAYDKLVDRLMASPRYGEHRARYWLDAARYADTHGMHFDNYREIWPYRDWVIDAFNRNEPFDQFAIDQLAGDLLPEPTRAQRIATGFQRCNITTNEGGTIEAENLVNYARDRVETTSWVFLGLTANCAVCHDHKFDPITQHDFYAMSAYYRHTTQGGLDGNVKDSGPIVRLTSAADDERLAAIASGLGESGRRKDERTKALRGEFETWLKTATPADWNQDLAKGVKPALHLPFDAVPADMALIGDYSGKALRAQTGEPVSWEEGGKFGMAPRFTTNTAASFDDSTIGDFEKDQSFSYGCWVKTPKEGGGALFSRMDDADGYRGWDVWLEGNRFAAHLIHHWSDDALKVRTRKDTVKRGEWQHVFVTYDGSGKAEGLRIYVDGQAQETDAEANTLKTTTRTSAPFKIARRKNVDVVNGVSVQDLRIYTERIPADLIARLAATPRVLALLAIPQDKREAKARDEVFALWSAGDEQLAKEQTAKAALEQEKKGLLEHVPVTHVQEEKKDGMPEAFILFRGQYDQPKDKVDATVFGFLNPLPPGAPHNRLGLAQWLVAKDNPLVARVTVNRMWQEYFGTGIVKTVEDFGIMGEAPSHPELLDWLAVEFRDGGWDMKKLVRLIVTSATYRQAAATTPAKLEKDPSNRLLAHGPRFRMDAEMIRDYALAAAGALSSTMGGPGVKPYQPGGVWDKVGMREGNTHEYVQDHGDALYRRSIYDFWKRMAPPAALEILNAPARETSCLRRERTDTPMQALVTMNDPQFIEAARLLAQKALAAPGDDVARLDVVSRRVLARPLTAPEAKIVGDSLRELRTWYQGKPDDAKALIAVGETKADAALAPSELAAWTMLCNQLLNLDEVLNK